MDNFQLQWNQFEDNLATSFQALRNEGELYDVTLACDDDQVEAHKMILSASSGFFKTILKRNPHAHPLLYLKGVKIQNLRSLLDFMYLGKANVAQDQVETFLKLGEELDVKGLVSNQQGEDNQTRFINENITKAEHNIETRGLTKKSIQLPKEVRKEITEIITYKPEKHLDTTFDKTEPKLDETFEKTEPKLDETFEKTEPKLDETFDQTGYKFDKTFEKTEHQLDETFSNMNVSKSDLTDSNDQAESLMERTMDDDGQAVWQCSACNKVSRTRNNLKKHVEIHITGLSFSCKFCDKVWKTRNSLNTHMYTSKPCKNKRISGI